MGEIEDNFNNSFATVDQRVGEVNFTAPISQNGLSEYYLANNVIHAGTENQIIDSSKCSILHGSNNIIKDKYNCHIIGDYIGQEGFTDIDDNSFNIGCYNGLNSWGKITVKRGGAEINGNLLIKEDSNSSTAGLILTNHDENETNSVRLTQSVSDVAIENNSDMMQSIFLAAETGPANWWAGGWFLRQRLQAFVGDQPVDADSYGRTYTDRIKYRTWIRLEVEQAPISLQYAKWVPSTKTWNVNNYLFNNSAWVYITIQTPVFQNKQSFWMWFDGGGSYLEGWAWTSIEAWPYFYIEEHSIWCYAFVDNNVTPSVENTESIIDSFDLSSDEVIGSIQTSEALNPGRDLVVDSTDQDELGNLVVEGSIKSAHGDIVMGAIAMGDQIKIVHDHDAPDSVGDYTGTGGSSGNKPTYGGTTKYSTKYKGYPKGSIYINSGSQSTTGTDILYVKTANSDGWKPMSSVSYVDEKMEIVQESSQTVAILSGVIAHGQQVPLPSGFSQNQCKWIVSVHYLPSYHGDHNRNHNITVKTGGQNDPDVSGRWVYAHPVGGGGNTDCLVNYLIIGIK